MRFVCALMMGFILLGVGCESSSVKQEYMPIGELMKDKKFIGYEVVVGPGLLDPYEAGAKEEDRNRNIEKMDMKGPMRFSDDIVGGIIEKETGKGINGSYLHRCVNLDGKVYDFRVDENAAGYGYRLVSVRNQDDELGIFLLKTKTPITNPDSAGGRRPVAGGAKKGGGKKGDAKKDDAKKDDAKKDDADKAAADKAAADKAAADKAAADKAAADKAAADKAAADKAAADKAAADKAAADKAAADKAAADKAAAEKKAADEKGDDKK